MKRFLGILISAAILLAALTGCSAKTNSTSPSAAYAPATAAPAYAPFASAAASSAPMQSVPPSTAGPGVYNTEEYDTLAENGFVSVASAPVSTFSADVDTASYCNLRRMIDSGYKIGDIPAGAVRTEEMLNYFTYDYAAPNKGKPFGMTASISDCPWNAESQLLVFGITTRDFDYEDIGGCNYVFLIDTSGSMDSSDKLGLLKESMLELLSNLSDRDRISIITYSGSYSVLAEGVYGDDRRQLERIIGSLHAGGSTNGGDALIKAYELAEDYTIPYGVNRIILCSDGDLNVGITSQNDLKALVSEKREGGIYLSVLGFGDGNYSDSNMETLADNGNGNYYYIDCAAEAEKVLSHELVSTLITVAEDVKFQIEFNPNYVRDYRQLGYENRQLEADDFSNDTIDAGEIGSGCCLTAVYEIIPAAAKAGAAETDLKYQTSVLTAAAQSDEWMTVSVRYKEPGKDQSKLLAFTIGRGNVTHHPAEDWRFAAAVCEFAMLLRDSAYKGTSSVGSILELLEGMYFYGDPYKAEFAHLVKAVFEG